MSTFTMINNILAGNHEIPEDSILSQTVLSQPDLRVILFRFARGQELSEHTAAKPALLHFLEGEAVVTLGDSVQEAGSNTLIHMEANLPHSIEARTAVSMLLVLLG
ncbi:MAG: cupin domain-containing protein [Anaerolineales bacterium]|nr:cupin domain-containing protein [Anaerolineales bacterium]